MVIREQSIARQQTTEYQQHLKRKKRTWKWLENDLYHLILNVLIK